MLILEGGAGGHMRHPFDLDDVKTGRDLVSKFAQIAKEITDGNLPDTKIDGVNTSIKLVDGPSGKEFAMDRGSGQPLDVEGITVSRLGEKFAEGHGMIAAGKTVLGIFNDALADITPELKALGLYDDSSKFFNMEYVKGTTNVLSYDHDFLKIHGVNQFYEKSIRGKPARPGLERPLGEDGKPIKDPSTQVDYSKEAMDSMVQKLNKYSKKYGFSVYSSIPSKAVKQFDFSQVGTVPAPVTISAGNVDNKTLAERLQVAQNRIDEQVTLKDGRKIPAQGKEIYKAVLGASAADKNANPQRQIALDQLLANQSDYQKAIDGAVFWHATRLLGNVIIDSMEVDHPAVHGPASDHEGMVIKLKGDDFATKITGEFILGGEASTFRKEEPDAGNSVGQDTKEVTTNRVIAIYPGRFHPFHKGHKSAYDALASKFGKENAFIFTSNKIELPKSPFTFDEKVVMMNAAGVDTTNVFQARSPYKAEEVLKKFPATDMSKTILVYGVSKKDMDEDPRFAFTPKKNGTPSYLQRYQDNTELQTMDKVAYVTVVPTITFNVLGQPASSASELRNQFSTLDEEEQKQFITDLYGKYSPEVHEIFKQKLLNNSQLSESFVNNVLKMIMEMSGAGVGSMEAPQSTIDLSQSKKVTSKSSTQTVPMNELMPEIQKRLKALQGNK
jgi:nicotinamide mononucleotide adenylyltransferase